jgi:hypothetical protein
MRDGEGKVPTTGNMFYNIKNRPGWMVKTARLVCSTSPQIFLSKIKKLNPNCSEKSQTLQIQSTGILEDIPKESSTTNNKNTTYFEIRQRNWGFPQKPPMGEKSCS